MNGFFTPVQVIKKNHYEQYSLQRLHKFQLFQMTQPLIISLAEERKQLRHWLQTLTLSQRRHAATIHSAEFVCLIRKLFQEATRLNQYTKYKYVFTIKQEKYVACRQKYFCKHSSPSQEFLLKQIVLISQGQIFQAFTLSDDLLNDIQSLFKLFDDIQGEDPLVVYDLNHFTNNQLQTCKICFKAQIQQGQPKTLGRWIAEIVFKQISLGFVCKRVQAQCGREDMKIQEMQYSNLWRVLCFEQRQSIVLKGLNKSFEEIIDDYRHSIAIQNQQIPILYNQREKCQVVQSIVNCSPKILYNSLIYTSLSQSLQIYSMYKISILLEIQTKLSIQKQQQNHQHKKKKKKKNIIYSDVLKSNQRRQNKNKSSENLQQQLQVKFHRQNSRQREKEKEKKKEDYIKQNQIITENQNSANVSFDIKAAEVEKEFILSINSKELQQKVTENSFKYKYIMNEQWKQVNDFDGSKLPFDQKGNLIQQDEKDEKDENDEKDEKDEKENNRPGDQNIQSVFDNDKRLQDYYIFLKQKSRDKFRKIIYHRLLYIFSLFQINCRAFGSFANHLSLPESDLDIIIDSSILSYFSKENHSPQLQIVAALQEIQNILRQQQWVCDFQLLPKAKIPLLIFKANAGEYFALKGNQKTKLKLNGKNIRQKQGIIQVDLSIQPFYNVLQLQHMGVKSTQLISQWINEHSIFSKLLTIIKAFVKKLGLNKSYQGGVSSYAISVLVIASLRFSSSKVSSLNLAMQSFIIFLISLQKNCWLVNLQKGIQESKSDKAILINPCDGTNLLERSFRFGQLIKGLISWEQLIRRQLSN